MAAKPSNQKKKSLAQQLTDLSKTALYNLAKAIDIPGRSVMTKEEMITALAKKASQVKKILASIAPASAEKKPSPKQESPKAAKPKIAKDQSVLRKPKESTTPIATPQIWQGEEGPALPETYGETTLRAMTKNPHTAYVYWDIDHKTREQAFQPESRSQYTPQAVLRVYGESERPSVEIPVQLQAHHVYIELKPNQTYAFEIGIRRGEEYRTLVRSNLLTLPSEPVGMNAEVGADTEGAPGTVASSWMQPSDSPAEKR